MTDFECPDFVPHPEGTGCFFGGFSCVYWMTVEGCEHPHWERHMVGADGMCPCGNTYPGAVSCVVEFDASAVKA